MIRFEDLLKIIPGKFVCVQNGRRSIFSSAQDALNGNIDFNSVVTSIHPEGDLLVLELRPWDPPQVDTTADWISKEQKAGTSGPSFF